MLERLARLIRERNAIDNEIAAIIGRPSERGHVGEYLAAQLFGITLESSANTKGFDGRFHQGPLAGKTVNIKWYGKMECVLDIPASRPDHFLVMTGIHGSAVSSKGATRPWVIEAVYLFETPALMQELIVSGVKIGIATSVRRKLWESAELFPHSNSPLMMLTDAQRAQLKWLQ